MGNSKELFEKAKDYLSTLEKIGENRYKFIAEIESYKHLGFALHSIFNVCQSAILAKEEDIHVHTDLDIYNLLDLAKSLIPKPELEFLDEIKGEILYNPS
ncbi:hypothetical protein [Apibacter sp. HY039]|uniref:hypothetical protein n=1 Tax=Apibacter sp. HY039 TaxID=2501476 RepID=UPI000FEC0D9E|nr:hypothetical protein [Apibacter sp. HY039]